MRITINGVPANTGSWVGNSFDWLTGRAETLSMPVVAGASNPLHLYRGPS